MRLFESLLKIVLFVLSAFIERTVFGKSRLRITTTYWTKIINIEYIHEDEMVESVPQFEAGHSHCGHRQVCYSNWFQLVCSYFRTSGRTLFSMFKQFSSESVSHSSRDMTSLLFGIYCRKNDQSSNGRRVFDGENHNLQEYTYKKITPCDVCSQVLRGNSEEV